jgi:hypothetical protein
MLQISWCQHIYVVVTWWKFTVLKEFKLTSDGSKTSQIKLIHYLIRATYSKGCSPVWSALYAACSYFHRTCIHFRNGQLGGLTPLLQLVASMNLKQKQVPWSLLIGELAALNKVVITNLCTVSWNQHGDWIHNLLPILNSATSCI